MTIDYKIEQLKEHLLNRDSLESFFYFFLRPNDIKTHLQLPSSMNGEVEKIAISSFLNRIPNFHDLERIEKRIKFPYYRQSLNLFERIALFKEDSDAFGLLLNETFDSCSIRFKFLIYKSFPDKFQGKFISTIKSQFDSQNLFLLILQHIYLHESINPRVLYSYLAEELFEIEDLLLLEELQNINISNYNKSQEKLLLDIISSAVEIQSKHRHFNNSEDQYNSFFQSLLKTHKYKCLDQPQRGESFDKKQVGELDLYIYDQDDTPLSIFEAFKIDSIKSEYIDFHLKKLTDNYDANGLKRNYAVIYAKSPNFNELWKRYKIFVVNEVNYRYPLEKRTVEDLTLRYSHFTDIKICLTKHIRSGVHIFVYHIFMNMYFKP